MSDPSVDQSGVPVRHPLKVKYRIIYTSPYSHDRGEEYVVAEFSDARGVAIHMEAYDPEARRAVHVENADGERVAAVQHSPSTSQVRYGHAHAIMDLLGERKDGWQITQTSSPDTVGAGDQPTTECPLRGRSGGS